MRSLAAFFATSYINSHPVMSNPEPLSSPGQSSPPGLSYNDLLNGVHQSSGPGGPGGPGGPSGPGPQQHSIPIEQFSPDHNGNGTDGSSGGRGVDISMMMAQPPSAQHRQYVNEDEYEDEDDGYSHHGGIQQYVAEKEELNLWETYQSFIKSGIILFLLYILFSKDSVRSLISSSLPSFMSEYGFYIIAAVFVVAFLVLDELTTYFMS